MKLVITNNLHSAFKEALEETGVSMEEYAMGIVPSKTGTLRRSIEASVEENKVTLSADTPYALTIEMGSGEAEEIDPQPYLRPAMNRSFGYFSEYMKQVLS